MSSRHDDEEDDAIYKIVVTPGGYYTIQPVRDVTPAGWWDAGFSGTKRECLEWQRKNPLPV